MSEDAEITLHALSIPTHDFPQTDGAYGGQIILSDNAFVIGVDRDVRLSGPIHATLFFDPAKLPDNVHGEAINISSLHGGVVIPQGSLHAHDLTAGSINFSFHPEQLFKGFTHQVIIHPPQAAAISFLSKPSRG